MMKKCELCKSPATILCDSDQATLCWDCDTKVHSANFLVAKHSRTLMCHVCQSPTPWNASGYQLYKTVSVCRTCLDGCEAVVEESVADAAEIDVEDGECDELFSDQDDGDEVDRDDDDDVAVEGENQVVPRSSTLSAVGASLSSSEGESFSITSSLKRVRENSVTGDLRSDV